MTPGSQGRGETGGFAHAWLAPELLAEHSDLLGALQRLAREAAALEDPAVIGPRDLVLLPTRSSASDSYLLCVRLKAPGGPRPAVVLVCEGADRELVEPIGRFCLADLVLAVEDLRADAVGALAHLARARGRGPAASVEGLLARAEASLGGEAAALAQRVIGGLSAERERSFVATVTDPDSGLFTGPFMAFKLEEEFKRSWRFHSPLGVLLVDLPGTRGLGSERPRVLSEAAGVLLNECRDIDVLGRHDETSFLCLLPQTGEAGTRVLAQRILGKLDADVRSPRPLDAAIAIVTVPRTGIDRKDDLLDLLRLTLVSAWAGSGEARLVVAGS